MDGEQRRDAILKLLTESGKPLSAGKLAHFLGVSRQIIVGDVALMRASGREINATPKGYLLPAKAGKESALSCRIACRHDSKQMQDELYAIVDEGCTVRDVIVEHPLYGELTGLLALQSRHDVDEFIRKSLSEDAKPLSMLTEGTHLHTLLCPDEDARLRVLKKLKDLGVLVENP